MKEVLILVLVQSPGKVYKIFTQSSCHPCWPFTLPFFLSLTLVTCTALLLFSKIALGTQILFPSWAGQVNAPQLQFSSQINQWSFWQLRAPFHWTESVLRSLSGFWMASRSFHNHIPVMCQLLYVTRYTIIRTRRKLIGSPKEMGRDGFRNCMGSPQTLVFLSPNPVGLATLLH